MKPFDLVGVDGNAFSVEQPHMKSIIPNQADVVVYTAVVCFSESGRQRNSTAKESNIPAILAYKFHCIIHYLAS